jgi:hypothetical protein
MPISLYEAVEQGYEACLICQPPKAQASPIASYYTHWPWIVGTLTVGLIAGSVTYKKQVNAA